MHLERIRVVSLRNLRRVELGLGPATSVFYGENAQGKTNLIEAVYLLSNLQSFRTHRLRDLVESGEPRASVEGVVSGNRGRTRLQVFVEGGSRRALVDGKTPENTASYLSELHTVLFSPSDLDLARGDKELRRRYLDRATFLADPSHLARLRSYHRTLRHRNALLKSGYSDQLEVWDQKLAEQGAAVHEARRRILGQLEPLLRETHRNISGGREVAGVQCEAVYAENGDPCRGLLDLLATSRDRDLRMGFTTSGPHRDIVGLTVGERTVERYGSQGQMRTVALSLKLALLQWGQRVLGEEPVFLLDDPGSELDAKRLAFLGEFIAAWTGQVLVAATERGSVPLPAGTVRAHFCVRAGEVEPQ